jgi:hypothetical protein
MLAKSRGKGREHFGNECTFRTSSCMMHNQKSQTWYTRTSKVTQLKWQVKFFLIFNHANTINMNFRLLNTFESRLETPFSRQTIEKRYTLKISVIFQHKYIETSQ